MPHRCWDWQAEESRGPPRRLPFCHSPSLPIPRGLGISAAPLPAALPVPRAPLYVTCRGPAGVGTCSPSSRCVFLCVACFVDMCDGGVMGWLLSSSLIHSSQSGVGHRGRVRWGAGKFSLQFNKNGSQLGELCPLECWFFCTLPRPM